MDPITTRLREAFSLSRLTDYLLNQLLPDLIVAVTTLLGFYLLWRLLRRGLRVLERTHLDLTARSFIEQVLQYTIMTVGVVSALSQLGVNTASLVTTLGVAGLTLGFAARDTLSNLISGIFIFWDRPFVVNDLIETSEHYGRVAEITMRSTRVITVDGRMLAIPNAQIVNDAVASYTNFPNLRLEVTATVAVDEDLGRVRKLLLETVDRDDRFLTEPAPAVVVTELNDYNVALALRVWLKDERSHLEERCALRERVFETLRASGVDMPFETLQLQPVRVNTA